MLRCNVDLQHATRQNVEKHENVDFLPPPHSFYLSDLPDTLRHVLGDSEAVFCQVRLG
jgi:hypothetical protein